MPHTSTYTFLGMPAIIASRKMEVLLEKVKQVAASKVAVLVEGESGAGKELIARALHHFSPRRTAAWMDLNCAALPEELMESEMFGYERGAFPGAHTDKPGVFELAHGGTLFLDEVGDLHPRLQAKILRVLDGSGYYRVGGTEKVNSDFRLVTATNQNLERLVQEGRFRPDLLHRLTHMRVTVPPLRERAEDIAPLAELFLRQHREDLTLTEDALQALESFDWPGNVRELRNALTEAAFRAVGEEVRTLDLPEKIQDHYAGQPGASTDLQRLFASVNDGVEHLPAPTSDQPMAGMILQDMEKRLILQVLEQTHGHQERAARLLGISRRTLSRKLQQYGAEDKEPEFGIA
jgi:DNA-binding NtrC family response regulator